MPLITLRLEAGDESATIEGIVDSGATFTMLPLALAKTLKIRRQLRRDGGVRGVGGWRPKWRSAVPIHAEVLAQMDPQVGWGPVFELQPRFWWKDLFLLGRHDFFATFDVGFQREGETSTVVLARP